MSMPPPPPPPGPQGPQDNQGPYGYQPPGFQPPPGYQPFGGQPVAPAGNAGTAVAALVLSLVGLIPCFWLFQVPGLLGAIFGFVGMKQTRDGQRRGRGLAVAGLVIGLVLIVACAAFWIYFATSADCVRVGNSWECTTD